MNIRFATVEDVPTILGLIKELAEFEKLAHEVVATEELLADNLFRKRQSAEVLLAEKDGRVHGCAIFFHNFSTFNGKPGLYLEDLYVKPESRGEGTGMALLSKLAKIAIERDCGRMEWWVLGWNKKAIDLYLKLGAKPMDEWTVMRLTPKEISELAKHKEGPQGHSV